MIRSARRAWSLRPTAPGATRRRPRGVRAGFTMIELLFVLLISTVLLGMATSGFESAQRSTAAHAARDSYTWLANRARSNALERGETVTMTLKPDSALARITDTSGTIDVIYFRTQYGTAVSTSDNATVVVCYGPRGFALSSCSNGDLPQTVTFTRADQAYSARVQVLGQVDRL